MKKNVKKTGGMVEDGSLKQGKAEYKGNVAHSTGKKVPGPGKSSAKGKMIDGPYGSKKKQG